MIKIFAYEEGKVGCHCERCEQTFTENISDKVTEDNCALDIDIICKDCGDAGVLYFTKCKDEYMAKELLAKIERAKESRRRVK